MRGYVAVARPRASWAVCRSAWAAGSDARAWQYLARRTRWRRGAFPSTRCSLGAAISWSAWSRRWDEHECTRGVMESTGVYWKTVWHVLADAVELLLATAAHLGWASGVDGRDEHAVTQGVEPRGRAPGRCRACSCSAATRTRARCSWWRSNDQGCRARCSMSAAASCRHTIMPGRAARHAIPANTGPFPVQAALSVPGPTTRIGVAVTREVLWRWKCMIPSPRASMCEREPAGSRRATIRARGRSRQGEAEREVWPGSRRATMASAEATWPRSHGRIRFERRSVPMSTSGGRAALRPRFLAGSAAGSLVV